MILLLAALFASLFVKQMYEPNTFEKYTKHMYNVTLATVSTITWSASTNLTTPLKVVVLEVN